MMKETKIAPAYMNDRIYWVDTAKVFGLFLVFWGHILYGGSPVGGDINRVIYSFHMPMYFILSGYVVKPESKPFRTYVRNKFKQILLPTLILYVLTLPLYFLKLDYNTASISSIISTIFYLRGKCAYNLPIWFFFCIFQLLIVAKLLDMSNASTKKLIIISIINLFLSALFYESGGYSKYFHVFGFDKCLLGFFFYSFGILLKRTRYEKYMWKVCVIALPLWILFGIILNKKVSMYNMNLGIFGYFIISGIAGSFVFYALCKLFEKSDIVRQYAKWTVFVICSHWVLVTLFHVIATILSIKRTYTFDITSILFVLIALVLYRHVCFIIAKRVPVLIGK